MGRDLTNLPISASFQYLLQVSGSEVNDGLGNDVDSLNISASYATSASIADSALTATSASFATTASYAENAIIPTLDQVTTEGNVSNRQIDVVTGGQTLSLTGDSIASNTAGALTLTGGTTTNGDLLLRANSTGDVSLFLDGNNDVVEVAGDVSGSGTFTAGGFVGNLTGNADTATTANTASYVAGANVDGDVATATSSSAVLINEKGDAVSYRMAFVPDAGASGIYSPVFHDEDGTFTYNPSTNIMEIGNINATTITASNATFTTLNATSASIGFLQTITGSATIIGDSYIILNTSNATRYAGIAVEDSGSATPVNYTASWNFDSQTNDWFYQYTGSDDTEFAIAMFGPEYSTKGSPTYLTNNTIPKGDGGHHLNDSNITDDGSSVDISIPLNVTGQVSASSFIGDGSGLTGVEAAVQLSGSAYLGVEGGSANSYSNSVGIGYSSSYGANDVMIGAESGGSGDSVAIGHNANAGYSTTAVGKNSQAGNYGSAIGWGSDASNGGTAIGRAASAANNSVTIGGDATSDNSDAVAVGTLTDTSHQYGLALGHGAQATGALNLDIRANNSSIMTATTASQDVTFYGTASAPYFVGDGSQLTNLPGGDPFPYTGSADITGSIELTGGPLLYNTTGGTLNTITDTTEGHFILGGYLNTISNGSADIGHGILSSYNSTVSSTAYNCVIVGGNTCTISGGSSNGAFAASSATISSTQGINAIVGANTSTISGTATRSSIVGGNGNTIGGHDRSVILGGSSLSTSKDDEVVVPNLTTNGVVKQNVTALSITSNTASLDALDGNLYTLTLQNGTDTHLELSNQTAGQTFQLKITNNATAAGTITFDSQFDFEGGTAFEATAATSAVDILTFTTFDGNNVQCVGAKNFS